MANQTGKKTHSTFREKMHDQGGRETRRKKTETTQILAFIEQTLLAEPVDRAPTRPLPGRDERKG
jgi:hypothetical protein